MARSLCGAAHACALLLAMSAVAEPPTIAVPTDAPSPADPCLPACPDACAPRFKGKRSAAVCEAPPKIVVHQAEPIVEFRTAPGATTATAPAMRTDPAVKQVCDTANDCGGKCGKGLLGGHSLFSCMKNKTVYHQGHGGASGQSYAAPQMIMAPMAVQMQAYVPQMVVPQAVQFQPMAVQPAALTASAGPDLSGLRSLAALAQALEGAGAGSAAASSNNGAAAAAASAKAATAQLEAQMQALDARMNSLEKRVKAIEDGIDALCHERAKTRN